MYCLSLCQFKNLSEPDPSRPRGKKRNAQAIVQMRFKLSPPAPEVAAFAATLLTRLCA